MTEMDIVQVAVHSQPTGDNGTGIRITTKDGSWVITAAHIFAQANATTDIQVVPMNPNFPQSDGVTAPPITPILWRLDTNQDLALITLTQNSVTLSPALQVDFTGGQVETGGFPGTSGTTPTYQTGGATPVNNTLQFDANGIVIVQGESGSPIAIPNGGPVVGIVTHTTFGTLLSDANVAEILRWIQLDNGGPKNPIYHLVGPQGFNFYTQYMTEVMALVNSNSGWQLKGIAFSSGGTIPVFRLVNTINGFHFWTASAAEQAAVLNTPGWQSEGIGWNASSSGIAVNRLSSKLNGDHSYVADPVELANLLATGNYNNEGISFYSPL